VTGYSGVSSFHGLWHHIGLVFLGGGGEVGNTAKISEVVQSTGFWQTLSLCNFTTEAVFSRQNVCKRVFVLTLFL